MADDPIINHYLRKMLELGGSDLHLSINFPAKARIHGGIQCLDDEVITPEKMEYLMKEICFPEHRWTTFMNTHDLDFAHEIPGLARFRCNYFYNFHGMGCILRQIPSKILTLEDLHLPEVLKEIYTYHSGLVLVTGPTGSGKSTTMAAMIDFINDNKYDHILTIEDPIEFVHESKKCLINQREVHRDTHGFNEALRSALREDPDIILVGELRDLETIRLAMTAAETGHLVFGTLHTTSAAKTIDRIIDVFPAEEKSMVRSMLSESLQAVISQTLLKKTGGGRVAAHEIMLGTSAIRNLIREDKVAQMYSAIQTGVNVGMQTMDQCLQDLIQKRLIGRDVARSKARFPENF